MFEGPEEHGEEYMHKVMEFVLLSWVAVLFVTLSVSLFVIMIDVHYTTVHILHTTKLD